MCELTAKLKRHAFTWHQPGLSLAVLPWLPAISVKHAYRGPYYGTLLCRFSKHALYPSWPCSMVEAILQKKRSFSQDPIPVRATRRQLRTPERWMQPLSPSRRSRNSVSRVDQDVLMRPPESCSSRTAEEAEANKQTLMLRLHTRQLAINDQTYLLLLKRSSSRYYIHSPPCLVSYRPCILVLVNKGGPQPQGMLIFSCLQSVYQVLRIAWRMPCLAAGLMR